MSTQARAPIAALVEGDVKLEGGLAHHLARVLRLTAGDALVAFDPTTGREADATIVRADRDGEVVLRVGALRDGAKSAEREIVVIQGLAKGDKCDAVVRDATELGATRIIVAATERSVVRLDAERASSRQARWMRIAEQAARQSGRATAPVVDDPCTWKEALMRVDDGAARFCLWERATEPLGPPLMEALTTPAPLAFAIGSEGGLTEDEAHLAESRGWALASLGALVLRTETVAASVLGAVLVLSRR
jgi:16S rRNA (uracil1498-N3)-methyltransferase